jgi:cytochrome c-type biogenesis protein CcmF
MDTFGIEGRIGFALIDLATIAAALSAVALTVASVSGQVSWRRIGLAALGVHVGAILSTLALLIGLLITHRFEYNYVWSHSSRELPLHFVTACLWEGQEGSFLVWMVWHAVLAVVVWLTAPGVWRAPVLAVIASVQAILGTMILGAFVPAWAVQLLLSLLLVAGGGVLWQRWRAAEFGLLPSLLLAAAALAITNLWTGTSGLWSTTGSPALWLEAFIFGAATTAWLWAWGRRRLSLSTSVASASILVLAWVILVVPVGGWQVGSSPFILLREAMASQEVFAANPQFIPPNGRGLNPLLQNYWMVIHPPIVFMGFALTLVPFAFVVAGLLTGDVKGWLRPASPWLVASVAVLGVGILMGGYWAYETLNFGGYWNWDPVENASLVPWLTGVASLHLALAYRHGGAQLRGGALLVISTFLLVLYSTFLVRSGVLGDSSVHSFTDLGMSGQLLVLLFVYVIGIVLLAAHRWQAFPKSADESAPFFSRETFLLLAAVVLTFAAVQITLTTSLPVANKVFGTNLAPSGKIQFYYYQWNVWVGVLIALLSAVGQFLFWQRSARTEWWNALFRPFAAAAVAACALYVILAVARWPFVYEALFTVEEQKGIVSQLTTGVLRLADEFLLFAALFTVLANLDILIQLFRKRGKAALSTGGSLAHIGFGLMLLGILFSSGYEQTVSVNFSPGDLGEQFPERERLDNVLLVQQRPKYLPGYRVVYRGKAQAEPPISQLNLILEEPDGLKIGFTDARGERFGLELPASFFAIPKVREQGIYTPASASLTTATKLSEQVDFGRLRTFVESNLDIIRPQLLNNRKLYQLEFAPLDAEQKFADSARSFVLMPEAEVSPSMGLVLHPDRQVSWTSDLYVYVSSIPAAEADAATSGAPDTTTRRMKISEWRARTGDTLRTERATVILDQIVQVTDDPQFEGASLVVRAKLRVLSGGKVYGAEPNFILGKNNDVQHADARIERLGMQFSFAGVNPKENHVVIQVGVEDASDDFITIKAIRKPWINLLWLGTIVMTLGFGVAVVRRGREARAARSAES